MSLLSKGMVVSKGLMSLFNKGTVVSEGLISLLISGVDSLVVIKVNVDSLIHFTGDGGLTDTDSPTVVSVDFIGDRGFDMGSFGVEGSLLSTGSSVASIVVETEGVVWKRK